MTNSAVAGLAAIGETKVDSDQTAAVEPIIETNPCGELDGYPSENLATK
jgi:hypothetical protein